MRRFVALSLLVALTGCALPKERAVGERWIGADEDGVATLTLTAPGQAARVTMTCRPHSGTVDVTVLGRKGDGAVVQFHAGEVWNRYSGAGHAEGGSSAIAIDFKLAASDPVLASLADTGGLTLVFTDRIVVPPNAFAPAHDFMATCRLP